MKPSLKIILSMLIFGSVGIVSAYIPLPAATLAGVRALLGALFVAAFLVLRKASVNKSAIKSNLLLIVLSGAALAFNWLLLFEAYKHTSVAVATVCYYLAPVIVTALSPFLFGEKLTSTKLLCILAALAGAVLVSGVTFGDSVEFQGVLFALGAAVLYATVVILNKKMPRVPDAERTFYQLGVAAVVTLPYAFFSGGFAFSLSGDAFKWLLVMGLVHTAVAYLLFFSASSKLPAMSTALLSYIDPATAVLLSVFWLGESLDEFQIIGAILIIGASLVSECFSKKKR